MRALLLLSLAALAGCHDAGLPGPGGDLAGVAPPDLAVGERCVALIECVDSCGGGDQGCKDACLAMGTPDAQGLMKALIDCLDAQCPRTGNGVCNGTQPATCDACLQGAQAVGAACDGPITACDAN